MNNSDNWHINCLDQDIKSLEKGIEIVKKEPDNYTVDDKIEYFIDHINYDLPLENYACRLSNKLEPASEAEKIRLKTQCINCLINILKQFRLMEIIIDTKLHDTTQG